MPRRTKNNRKIYKIKWLQNPTKKPTKIKKNPLFGIFFDCEDKKLILKGRVDWDGKQINNNNNDS